MTTNLQYGLIHRVAMMQAEISLIEGELDRSWDKLDEVHRANIKARLGYLANHAERIRRKIKTWESSEKALGKFDYRPVEPAKEKGKS